MWCPFFTGCPFLLIPQHVLQYNIPTPEPVSCILVRNKGTMEQKTLEKVLCIGGTLQPRPLEHPGNWKKEPLFYGSFTEGNTIPLLENSSLAIHESGN